LRETVVVQPAIARVGHDPDDFARRLHEIRTHPMPMMSRSPMGSALFQ
jgi:hypothetical protein